MACSFTRFEKFTEPLARAVGDLGGSGPMLLLGGSGDFHHVSLALCRRVAEPFNLLVVDKHPDWVGPLPLLHCGSWLRHAAALERVGRVFHVGGQLDFENGFRHAAPWSMLQRGKIVVFPAVRPFVRGKWRKVPTKAVRPSPQAPVTRQFMLELLEPWREELSARPVYISLDKDVMPASQAAVNWDSGVLDLAEVIAILDAFIQASGNHLAGMDIFGDYSHCRTQGLLRRLLDWSEHPRQDSDAAAALAVNTTTNKCLLNRLCDECPRKS
jgi:arginase family enzyme